MKRLFLRLFLLAAASVLLNSCAIINTLLSIPGALIKSGALPVQVVENGQQPAESSKIADRVPVGGETPENERLPVVRNEAR